MLRLLTKTLQVLMIAASCSLLGCGDGLEREASDYQTSLSLLLTQNVTLVDNFLEMTRELKTETIGADEIASKWEASILPSAVMLSTEAEALQPESVEFQAVHELLVFAWAERSESYKQLLAAYQANNPGAFQKAFDRNLKAKLAEEQYFTQVNALLNLYGLQLTPY